MPLMVRLILEGPAPLVDHVAVDGDEPVPAREVGARFLARPAGEQLRVAAGPRALSQEPGRVCETGPWAPRERASRNSAAVCSAASRPAASYPSEEGSPLMSGC